MRVEIPEHSAQRRVGEFLVIDLFLIHIILPDQLHRPRKHGHAGVTRIRLLLPIALGDRAIRDDSEECVENEEQHAGAEE